MSDFRTTSTLSAASSLLPSSGDSFIDMEIFKEEAELFGKDVIMDIINEFLKTYKKQIEQIETDLKNKDCMKLERSAHKLAGSIANFYADEIYTMVKTVEKNAHNGNIEEAAAMYAKLTTYIDPFIQELEKIKDSLHN
jgi:HPt (histidine-containing phosphotransfer) domain-containing protein